MTGDTTTPVTVTKRQRRLADWMTDVLIYVVVLNLFVELADAIVIESFCISILTAVLLVALLEVVNIVFGDQVELGHFVDVLVLIITMMVVRAVVGRIYKCLGPKKRTASSSPS